MGRALLVINADADRQKASHWVSKAPWGTRIEFKASKRSLPQNDRLWAMLTDVQTHMKPLGRDYPTEDWKLLFMQAWGKEIRLLPSLDNRSIVPVGQSSSDLSKQEMTDLIEFIYAWGAENGVVFHEPKQEPSDSVSPSASDDGSGVSSPLDPAADRVPAAADPEAGDIGAREEPDASPASDPPLRSKLEECRDKFLAIAADKALNDDDRRKTAKVALTAWRGELPGNLSFVEACLESLGRIVKGGKPGAATDERTYLNGLIARVA
jgi:hypothetical protein